MDGGTRVVFIRHGEVDNPKNLIYGRTIDVLLSEKGFDQIRKISQTLKDQGFLPSVIYTSPLTRTLQSTKTIKEIFPEAEVHKKEKLLDTDEPVLADKTHDLITKEGVDEYSFPGVESPISIVQRMRDVYLEAVQENIGKTIFFVGHGDPTAFFIWSLFHKGEELPPIRSLQQEGFYPKKGEAWGFIANADGTVRSEISVYSPEAEIVRKSVEG